MKHKIIFRVLLVIPLLFIAVAILMSFFYPDDSWPEQAIIYVEWWKMQPFSEMGRLKHYIFLLSEMLFIVATIALLLLIKQAKYLYVISVLLLILAGYQHLPVLLGGWQPVLENAFNFLMGVNCALLFTSPYKNLLDKNYN